MKLERMKQRREDLRLSQEALGKKIGVTGKTIWRLENGEREIKSSVLLQIAGALDTSVAYLMGETDDPGPISGNATPTPLSTQPFLADCRTFGERLRAYRRAKDWGQEILAEKLGLPQSKIAAMEAGKLKPNQEQLQQLAEALEISPDALSGGEEFPSKPATQSGRDLDSLIKELAAKNPDLVWRLRNTSQNIDELKEETKQSLADGLSYVLGLIELDDLPKHKRPKI